MKKPKKRSDHDTSMRKKRNSKRRIQTFKRHMNFLMFLLEICRLIKKFLNLFK